MAALHDIPAAVADQRIQQYLDRFDLTAAADRRIDGYSTGMRKKVGLIQAEIFRTTSSATSEPTRADCSRGRLQKR